VDVGNILQVMKLQVFVHKEVVDRQPFALDENMEIWI
jgi:hypothetical protein